jgi:large subunit ribosomal protein L5
MKDNIMRTIKIERIVLNIGGVEDKLNKGFILLQKISGKKPVKVKAKKRIPTWGVRPGLEVGVKVTLRDKKAEEMLKILLGGISNTLKEKQIQKNFVSFGIKEYIEIPGVEYIREVGIMGFEVTIVFSRPSKRIGLKKAKRGIAKRQEILPEEIIKFMEDKFETKIIRRKK